jgi:hypothetical protein
MVDGGGGTVQTPFFSSTRNRLLEENKGLLTFGEESKVLRKPLKCYF